MKRIDFSLIDKTTQSPSVSGGIEFIDTAFKSESRKLKDVLQFVADKKSVFWVSEGEWSMHQLLIGLLEITGKATVYISSYAMGETPARILSQLIDKGNIIDLYCLLDSRVEIRTANSLQLIKSISTNLKLITTHAKVTLIENDNWQIAVIGSANYTENKRFESGVITCSLEGFELNKSWMTKCLNYDS